MEQENENISKDFAPLIGANTLAQVALREVLQSHFSTMNDADIAKALMQHAKQAEAFDAIDQFSKRLLGNGYTKDKILHAFVPRAMRLAGDAWKRDALSWAEVSIIGANLEEFVARFAPSRSVPSSAPPRVLALTPRGEDHTIGAAILQKRLLGKGQNCALSIGKTIDEIKASMSLSSLKLIAISAHDISALGELPDYIAFLRRHAPNAKIALGGNVLQEPEDLSHFDLDLLTCDIQVALLQSGLETAEGLKAAPSLPQ